MLQQLHCTVCFVRLNAFNAFTSLLHHILVKLAKPLIVASDMYFLLPKKYKAYRFCPKFYQVYRGHINIYMLQYQINISSYI